MSGRTSVEFPLQAVTFPTVLGWMALAMRGATLHGLTFGHRGPRAALQRLFADLGQGVIVEPQADEAARRLATRLQAYAAGALDDFRDVPIAAAESAFQRAVIRHCRRIPYAATLTYGELAARAGSPRAARAVGNIMARNRTPLVVPCHRVVGADGRMCGYSAGDGTRTKLRLLEQEALHAATARAVAGATTRPEARLST
jgi:methylated-DNA-[protein]-cysteine S-methyltransferase